MPTLPRLPKFAHIYLIAYTSPQNRHIMEFCLWLFCVDMMPIIDLEVDLLELFSTSVSVILAVSCV